MAKRDEFPAPVVRIVAQRAGYVCSYPGCRKITAGPHSDPTKAIITGEACHIHAAAPGGPRYDSTQTPEQRRHITNAIWLCAVCSKKADTDYQAVPAATLLKWKQDHEKWIADEGMMPDLPMVALASHSGLRLIPKLPEVTSEMLEALREQELAIRNSNRVELHNLKLHMRLPEALLVFAVTGKNAGTQVAVKAEQSPWTVEAVQPGGAVRNLPQGPTSNQTVEIPRLSAGETVTLLFYTLAYFHVRATPDPSTPPTPVEDPDTIMPQDHRLWWYLQGTFQYVLRGEYITSELFLPLRYSFRTRTVTSLPCQPSSEGWELLSPMLFPGVQLQG